MACNCKNRSNTVKTPVKTVVKSDKVTNNGKIASTTKKVMRRNFK